MTSEYKKDDDSGVPKDGIDSTAEPQLPQLQSQEAAPDEGASERTSPVVGVSRPLPGKTQEVVEAILFAAQQAMTPKQIQQVFPELERPELKDIQAAIDAVQLDYRARPVQLKKLASGYRFQIKPGLSPWIGRLFAEKPPKYSRALLETLAIIAYRQPVTRGEIEDIRGVSVSSNIIKTLLEREWIRVLAHKEVPGRPALYGTTKQLLDYFNLSSLEELPKLDEIAAIEQLDEQLHQTDQIHCERKTQQAQAASAGPGEDFSAAEDATSSAGQEPPSKILH